MRLWSIHPRLLDTKGLVALWRESLLAQAVLYNETKGYRNHPQLIRFRNHSHPTQAISSYLTGVLNEATSRGHLFDASKIRGQATESTISVTQGQLEYEYSWLCKKLETRSPEWLKKVTEQPELDTHPLFTVIEGDVEKWEKK